MENVRVRFAPSPTGYLHIGGARTALFNWFFAKKNHGKFILRIEDTDTERLKKDSVSQILTSLKWLGLDWDEGPEKGGEYGPYYQSQRTEIYRQEAQRLVKEGKAYYCFCTAGELEAERELQRKKGKPFRYSGQCRNLAAKEVEQRLSAGEKHVIRIKSPQTGQINVTDIIHGKISFTHDEIDDNIIMKSNGMPTYNFACVIDDNAMHITHVIRAEEHLSNTPKQVILYEALGYKIPQFAHLPMILAPDRSKLSKRHGATSVEEFKDQGFLAPAIVNYLTLLGWSPRDEREIFSPEDSIKLFELNNVNKKAAIYDIKKLTWMNGQYLTSENLADIVKQTIPFMIKKGLITEQETVEHYEYISAVIHVVRERVKTLAEVADASEYFFKDVTAYDEKGVAKHFAKPGRLELLAAAKDALAGLDDFNLDTTEKVYRELIERRGVKGGDLIHPPRLALPGRTVSPGLFDIMVLLGKEKCLARLDQAIVFIKNEVYVG